jgi:hypothetical protein
VPNTNYDVVCITGLKCVPAFSNAGMGVSAAVSGTMAKERQEDGCGKSEGVWSAFAWDRLATRMWVEG